MGRPDLTPSQQYLHLRRNLICAGDGALSATGLVWRYPVRPSVLSREYLVRIEFRRDETPRVFIEQPDLYALTGGRDPPHIYHDPVRLCLFLPGTGEWQGFMRIDQTFVPWTATWLYYFEEWLDSGDWKGGGEHPAADDSETSSRRIRRALRGLGPSPEGDRCSRELSSCGSSARGSEATGLSILGHLRIQTE